MSRQPAGIPVGGQFAARARARAQLDLGVPLPGARAALDVPAVAKARAAMLARAGFVPATGTEATNDPASATGREHWWDYNFRAAEYGHDRGDFPQMPDDETPSQLPGRSLSGHRRTHRVAYSGAGMTLRMPSATAVRRFAETLGNRHEDNLATPTVTFDVPVSATLPERSVDGSPARMGGATSAQGWVRVTRRPDGSWNTQALNFSDKRAAVYLEESVASVLEARRPSRALTEVGDMLAAHAERLNADAQATAGMALENPPSSWIDGMGYDPRSQTMVMTTAGRVYGYRVPPETYDEIRSSTTPGSVYNRLVKHKARRVQVRQCPSCGRTYSPARKHNCRADDSSRDGTRSLHNRAARGQALRAKNP